MAVAVAVAASMTCAGAQAAEEPSPVFTRARLDSVFQEAGGKVYVRLKLLPGAKLPFTTQTFRLVDRAQVDGLAQGAWVRFTSKRVDGENRVTAIQATPECRRFQSCD